MSYSTYKSEQFFLSYISDSTSSESDFDGGNIFDGTRFPLNPYKLFAEQGGLIYERYFSYKIW